MKIRVLLILALLLGMVALLAACGNDDDDSGDDDAAADDDNDTSDDDDNDDNDDDDNDDNDDDDDDDDDDVSPPPVPYGIYEITGSDTHGDLTGTVEIRPTEGKGIQFLRVATYPELEFADPYKDVQYEVHTAWTGELTGEQLSVTLQVADFMVTYGDLTRTEDDGLPVTIAGTVGQTDDDTYAVLYASDEASPYEYAGSETWTYREANGAEPIFIDEDTTDPMDTPPVPDGVRNLLFALLSGYHELPFFDDYRDREEFQAAIHYYHHYHTDFAWYREHPDAVRVVNKWLDDISLAETMLRSRAFGPTLAEKAAWFDEEMPQYFLNPTGFYAQATVGVEPLLRDESGDGMLWSGCYLASQVFRYLETSDAAALANWLKVLDGMILAHDIPQDDTTFARAVRPHVADGNKDWVQGAAPYEAYDWLTGGNNDMIQGLYYSYTLSYIYLPADSAYDSYREAIALRAARLADYCGISRDDGFNEIKANLLAYLTTGETRFLDRFTELWSVLYQLWTDAGGGMFYLWGVSDWSGQHLNTVGALILQFLADATGVEMGTQLRLGWVNGMRLNGVTGQVLWPIAAYSFANPSAGLDNVLENAIWGMREIPYPKQQFQFDQRIDPAWCASPWPSLFWKFDWFQGGRYQGLYGTPLFEHEASFTYFNHSPFVIDSGASTYFNGGGADYLHAYWLGRHYGVIAPED